MSEDLEKMKQGLAQVRKDFEVAYRFLSYEEGGRKSGPPHQPYRSDWSYEGDDPQGNGIYMIWPIFLDDEGQIVEPNRTVPNEGTAQMFIVNDELRQAFHAKRLDTGVRGYFMEGSKRVAEAVVTKLLALQESTVR